MLLLCQGGRFLTYTLGSEPNPMRVRIETRVPFDLSRDQQGIVLLCIALSAICIYSVCRLNYRRIGIPDQTSTLQYLPYLYLLFYLSVPVQIFKNYNYYQYAQAHGGYMYFWGEPWRVRRYGAVLGAPWFRYSLCLASWASFFSRSGRNISISRSPATSCRPCCLC